MIKINLSKEITDLNEQPIVFDTVKNEVLTVRTTLTAILGQGTTQDFITAIDIGLKIKNHKGTEIELEQKDVDFLKEAVKASKYIDVVKYKLNKELE